MTPKRRRRAALVLDEMFPPDVAVELRRRGFEVVAVAEDLQMRAMSDADLYRWATENRRRIVTENVKDFRRLASTVESGPGLLFTSTRTFPRSRRSIGLIISALEAWLRTHDPASSPNQEWLRPVEQGR